MTVISGLSKISSKYDTFIIDAWGVLHDGHRPLPDVIETLNHLKTAGKEVIIITNSPSRKEKVIADLNTRGISQGLYSEAISSGEIAFQEMQKMLFEKTLPDKCFYLGQNKHLNLIEELELQIVPQLEQGMFLLNTGPIATSDSLEFYQDLLTSAKKHAVQMVCVNPDQVVFFQGKPRLCAGSIAKLYEEIGGSVTYFGKPYPSIYQQITKLVDPMSRLAIIGDSPETDIRGGMDAGIDTILVYSGITAPEAPLTVQPTYCMKQLQW